MTHNYQISLHLENYQYIFKIIHISGKLSTHLKNDQYIWIFFTYSVQYSTVLQYRTVHCCTVQYSTAVYCTIKFRASYRNNLQLFLSAVDELIKRLRTRCCIRFVANIWTCAADIKSNNNFVLFILLVQRHLSGIVSIKKSDTTKQLPTTSVHKYWLEEKKQISWQEDNGGIIFVSLLPNPEKMSRQHC